MVSKGFKVGLMLQQHITCFGQLNFRSRYYTIIPAAFLFAFDIFIEKHNSCLVKFRVTTPENFK